MQTLHISVSKQHPNPEGIAQAGSIIRQGGLVAFPTETVYGLGGDALNPESAKKIYAAKGRPSDNPLIVHICRFEDMERIAATVSEQARKLADAFWPGPLTMILPKADCVPTETTGGLSTVAIRFPEHPAARAFIEAAGGFVAAPSANLSGRPSPTKARYVMEDMDGRIDMIIDGGDVEIGLESTIVDLTGDTPMILRPGHITQEMLTDVLERVETDRTILSGDSKERPRAPGMKYRHYAPKGELTIVAGDSAEVTEAINQLTGQAMEAGKKTGVIGTQETIADYRADSVKCVGARADEEEIARKLYTILREFDEEGVEVIYSESFGMTGMGQAIMNRLLKAAGHRIIQAETVCANGHQK